MASGPNVILLTIDALRADHLSYHGYDRETSPTLDRLADESAWFTCAWSVSSHTREAMPPLLSGYRPETFAANGFQQVEETLAGRLSDVGYWTGGFHSNPYLSRAFGFDRGFNEFYDDLLLGQNKILALAQRALEKFVTKRGEYYARAPEINRRSLKWVDSVHDEPFFLWNHYMDAHGPYHAPQREYAEDSLSASEAESLYRKSWKRPEELTAQEKRLLEDGYDDEIRHLDSKLAPFIDELRDRNLFEESLVIVTADHGDAFGEQGHFTHPRFLYESLLHVPLIVSPPGDKINTTVTVPVSTIDLVPTVLRWANLPDAGLSGTPLVDENGIKPRSEDNIVYALATGEDEHSDIRRFAARDQRWKGTIERQISTGEILQEQIYDLKVDPHEQKEIIPEEADAVRLVEHLRSFSKSRLNADKQDSEIGPPEEITEGINDRLEALGYK